MDLSGKLNDLISEVKNSQSSAGASDVSSSASKSSESKESSLKESSVFINSFNDSPSDISSPFLNDIEEEFSNLFDLFNFDMVPESSETEVAKDVETEDDKFKKAYKNVSAGNVFEVPGDDCLYIKKSSGDYEKLDISFDTYERLFEKTVFGGRTGSYSGDEENTLSDNINNLLKNPDSKAFLLTYFSEDEKGHLTFNIPNTDYGFTIEKGKSVSDYDETLTDSIDTLASDMIELALGSMLFEDRVSLVNAWLDYDENVIAEEKDKHSDEFNKKLADAISFANENNFSAYDILSYFEYSQNDASVQVLREAVSPEMYEKLSDFSKEEIASANIDYVYSLIERDEFQIEIEELKKDPYMVWNREHNINEINLNSLLFLNKDGKEVSEKSIKQAEEIFEKYSFDENFDFNKNILASYLDDNEVAQDFMNSLTEESIGKLSTYDILDYMQESVKEGSDADFLFKLSQMDISMSPRAIIFQEIVTPENIDVMTFLHDTYKESYKKDQLSRQELISLSKVSKIMDKEALDEYLQKGKFEDLIKTSEYIADVMPDFEFEDTTRGQLIKEEIDMLLESSLTGKDVGDISVPTLVSISEGIETTEVGDVFEVEGEDKIYIKTSDEEYQQLDISKDAYNKLFPPLQRYMSSQGETGDCYLVSTLNNMMTDPTMRSTLFQCFSEDEAGNITVDLPNGDYTFTLENGKEVTDYEDSFLLSDSSMGMQMLELCYGVYLKDEEIENQMFYLDMIYANIEEEASEYSDEQIAVVDRYVDILKEYNDKYSAEYGDMDYPHVTSMIFSEGYFPELEEIVADYVLRGADEQMFNEFMDVVREIYDLDIADGYVFENARAEEVKNRIEGIQIDTYGTEIRGSGGHIEKVFEVFGMDCDTHWLDDEALISDLLDNPSVKIVAGGTYGTSDEYMLDEELNIAACHAYTIYPVKQENGEYLFEVINPWDESRTSILTEAQMGKYFDSIQYVYV